MVLETERLILREMVPEDFDALYAIFSDVETMQHYPAPFSEEKTHGWIERNQKRYAELGFGLWAVVLKETGAVIGDCGLTLQNIDGEWLPEIGYHIHKSLWRKGLGSEAARAVRDWAFTHTDYPCIYCYMKYTNTGSYSTAMAAGMRKIKEYADPINTVSHVYCITREEWCQLTKQVADPMNYKIVDLEHYYRRGVFRHFSEDCKCSTSITHRLDVTDLLSWSHRTGTKFYLNFLYVLSKALNSREDYRLSWRYQTQELLVYDQINPTQYIFHDDTETFTLAYTLYDPDYRIFYQNALADAERAKATRDYGLDAANHPNWFDASCIPWISYDALHLELPDGYLYLNPIVNWGKYREENGRMMMPVTVRMNHAAADGYLIAKVFLLMEDIIKNLCQSSL